MAKVTDKIGFKDAQELIERRLSRLAMCKRGVIATDINLQRKELGPKPHFSNEEILARKRSLSSELKKAFTPTVEEIKKLNGDIYEISNMLSKKADKVLKEHLVHPDLKNWQKKSSIIDNQEKARMAQLDADFQDVMDKFLIGSMDLTEFPEEYNKLESLSW